jgi:hypothetical protein
VRQPGFANLLVGLLRAGSAPAGRVVDFRSVIEFKDGAHVRPGDVIVGAIDGIM